MIEFDLHIPEYDWTVHFHCAVTRYNVETIVGELYDVLCPESVIEQSARLMEEDRINTGFTFSDKRRGVSVVVVEKTSGASEFQNSLQHELRHLVDHICDRYDIRYGSEKSGYLAGNLNKIIFPAVKYLLCDCCRGKVHRSLKRWGKE